MTRSSPRGRSPCTAEDGPTTTRFRGTPRIPAPMGSHREFCRCGCTPRLAGYREPSTVHRERRLHGNRAALSPSDARGHACGGVYRPIAAPRGAPQTVIAASGVRSRVNCCSHDRSRHGSHCRRRLLGGQADGLAEAFRDEHCVRIAVANDHVLSCTVADLVPIRSAEFVAIPSAEFVPFPSAEFVRTPEPELVAISSA